jgi:polyhydroxyalkanoate synthase
MLRELGRPIYVIDWLPARARDDRSFADFAAGPVRSAVEHICAAHDVPALSLMGYSMGGTLATAFAARYPDRVARLAILCAPIRFDNAGTFTRLLSPSLVHVDLLALWDKVPSRMINLPFYLLDPMVKWRKLVELAKHVDDPRHLAYFLAVETWSHDSIDMPRGLVRSWIAELYQRNALVRGQLVVDGSAVSLSAIRCPALAVTGKTDTLAPPACSEGLPDARMIILDAGHIGVLTSRRALAAQAPALATWLGERA